MIQLNLERIPTSAVKIHNLTKGNKTDTLITSNPNITLPLMRPGKQIYIRFVQNAPKSCLVGLPRMIQVRIQRAIVKITCKKIVYLFSSIGALRANHKDQHIADAPSNTRDLDWTQEINHLPNICFTMRGPKAACMAAQTK